MEIKQVLLLPARVDTPSPPPPATPMMMALPLEFEEETIDVVTRVYRENKGAFECAWYAMENTSVMAPNQSRKMQEFDYFTRCLRTLVASTDTPLNTILNALTNVDDLNGDERLVA